MYCPTYTSFIHTYRSLCRLPEPQRNRPHSPNGALDAKTPLNSIPQHYDCRNSPVLVNIGEIVYYTGGISPSVRFSEATKPFSSGASETYTSRLGER